MGNILDDIGWKDDKYRGFKIHRCNNTGSQTRPNVPVVVKYYIVYCDVNCYFTTQKDVMAFIDTIKETET